MRKNKPQTPLEFLPCKNRLLPSTRFAFLELTKGEKGGKKYFITLVFYVPKKKKAIILASSVFTDDAVDPDPKRNLKGKPEIFLDNNMDKCCEGDVVNQMFANYSVQKTTKRWFWVVVLGLPNISGMNALCDLPQVIKAVSK